MSLGWREKPSPQQICKKQTPRVCEEAGNAVRHAHTHTHAPANLRLGGSVVVTVVVVVLLQLRANTHTLKHRRADSSRPLER